MGPVSPVEGIGFAAALLTLIAFAQTRMPLMRLAAIGANLLFLTYGVLDAILPVLALHAVLLPVNLVRLTELSRDGAGLRRASDGAAPERLGRAAKG